MRQRCRSYDRRVSDLHVVMQLIAFFQATQDGDGVFHARFRDIDFLEAALQRSILLYILAILV
ncbi:hypothetical protein D3C73_783300 [compost metagenome]